MSSSSSNNWNANQFMPIDVNNHEDVELFESLNILSNDEFLLLPKEKRDWQKDFAMALESSLKQQADSKMELAQREESRKRRVALISQGMSVENAVGGYS